MAVIELTDANFQETVDEDGITVVDFWAPWCGPCRVVGPVIEELAEENPDIRFGKLNVDDNQETAGAFAVRSIPTIAFFQNGEALGAVVGAYPKEALEDVLKQIREGKVETEETAP